MAKLIIDRDDNKLANDRIAGLDKITLNCLLAVWGYQAKVTLMNV